MSSLTGETSSRRKYTQEEKDQFFVVFDRLASVSSAADELGLNRVTCYQWVRKAGIRLRDAGKRPSGQRKYTQEQKAAFFALLERAGSASAAAAELGLNVNTCYQWVWKAGIAGKRPDPGRRDEFFGLRKAGVSRREAAKTVGVHPRTAQEWDCGIRKSGGRRIYPDGRVVDYKRGVTTMTTPTGTTAPLPPARPSALESPIDQRYLSLQDRETIRDMTAAGTSLRAIASLLGRSPSTISRELSRNTSPNLGYLPYAAQRAAASRRPRPKARKLLTLPRLREYVERKLRVRLSPEQISNTLIKEFPHDQEMRVTHETIYQALYIQGRGGLRREVTAALRSGRTRRKPHNPARHANHGSWTR